jgi:uncharacterized membrane protein YuzA (DUF378 family)
MNTRNIDRDGTDAAQKGALVIGALYTLTGLAGFLVTGFDDFAGKTGETLLGFEVNPLHNIVHLIIGLAGLAMWRRRDTARTFGWMLFVGYGATFFYGLAVSGKENGNILSLNGADNGLHLVSALAGLAIALAATRRTTRDDGASTRTGTASSSGAGRS